METKQTLLGWSRSSDGKGEPTYHPVAVGNCVTSGKRDNTQNYVMETEPRIAAMRDRDKDNPNERGKSNENYQQRLEPGPDNTSNTITSVSKDNLLIEPAILKQTRTEEMKEERRQKGDNGGIAFGHHYERRDDGITNALSTVAKDNMLMEPTQKIRIRRLTERELFRLMDVDEADIDILLSAGIAKTQLAKLAGNSIVVACLEGIFRNLLIDTEPQAGMQTKLF